MFSRRDLLKGVLSSGVLGPLAVACAGCGDALPDYVYTNGEPVSNQRPNILLVMCDQFRLVPPGFPSTMGEHPQLRELTGFANKISEGNPFANYFKGLSRLREHAVVARHHYIASAACAPSRTSIMTGQYPSLHGVTQVDGAFKAASEIPFLDPEGVPTIGDWFEASGYEAYYMGKWHVSDPPAPYDLTPWGFRGYETSGPEPHGSDPNNLGTFRDPGFGDIVVDFLNQRDPKSDTPWFAVASFVNPHDIVAYPIPFFGPEATESTVTSGTPPLTHPQPIPDPHQESNPNENGLILDLNPDGFPQETFKLPPGLQEGLGDKPSCQFDYSYKMQMALRALFPRPIGGTLLPYPFQRNEDYEAWVERYGQFYVYLQYLVDLEIKRILDALDARGLTENTIIVFTSDHGEYLCSHGTMIEKWHAAYEEVTHVAMVVSSPLINNSSELKEVSIPTSHIDLAPTLLGLAGIRGQALEEAADKIRQQGHTQVRPLVGRDLSEVLVTGQSPQTTGVLFTTDDRVTELPDGVTNPEKQAQYTRFAQDVEVLKHLGVNLASGPVLQPNSVRSLADGTWKFNRYLDPHGVEADQWEMYHLPSDPLEQTNLVDFRSGALRPGISVPGMSAAALEAKRLALKAGLHQKEQELLLTPA